jgi:sulfite exporter TauE/SafE
MSTPWLSVSEFSFAGGLLMGLASSLHCAGMCGAIASSMLFVLDPKGNARSRARVLMTAQMARIAAYVTAGTVLGAFGSAFYGLFDQQVAYRVLQWGAGVTLGWIGLSVAGLVPPIALLDRLMLPFTRRLVVAPAGGPRGGMAAPLMSGALWGLMPCAMVYGALFTAMLTGTAGGGATVMLGFGLGTLPAVTLSALGLTSLAATARGPAARMVVGLLIAAAGVLGIVLSAPGGPLCLTG